MNVRFARSGGGSSLRAIHVRAWIDAYVGVVPEEVVAARLPTVRNRDWEELLVRRRKAGEGVLTLVDDEHVVGFCELGPTEDADDDPALVGHVFRLFIDPLHQHLGGGRLLLEAACGHLREASQEHATLWVLQSDERARGFYEHLGWRPDGGRQGEPVADLRYGLALGQTRRPSA